MSKVGLDTSGLVRQSASVATVATDAVDGIEIQFQTYVGVTYQIEYSPDMVTWSLLPSVYQGDGTVKSTSISSTYSRLYFRMRETFHESSEPFNLLGYAAIDGTYVLLVWDKFTSTPASLTAHWKIARDNQHLVSLPIAAMSYRDTRPPAGRHTYTVGFYN